MSKNWLRRQLPWASVVVLILSSGALSRAEGPIFRWIDDTSESGAREEGRVVKIAPDDEDSPSRTPHGGRITPIPAGPRFWIGIAGRPVNNPLLREHLQLPAGQGVVVQRVVPDSPADTAGLQPRDILLVANGQPISDLSDLVALIGEGQGADLNLEFLRAGATQKVVVQPTERPTDFTAGPAHGPIGRLGDPVDESTVEDWFRQRFGGPQGQLQLPRGLQGRFFGMPGLNLDDLPSGVSVQAQRENDGPAKITVRRGNDTWVIEGDDPRALEELPEDVRPFVEGMFGKMDAGDVFSGQLDQFQEMLPGFHGPAGAPFGGQMMERLEAMERSMQELHERLRGESPAEENSTP